MLLVNTWSIMLGVLVLASLVAGLFFMAYYRSPRLGRNGSIAFGALWLALCIVVGSEGVMIAQNRAQDQLAQKEFAAAGYHYTFVNHTHAKIRINDCTAPFRVIMVHGIYRPAWPLKPNHIGGPIRWRAISPKGMKYAYCSA